MIRVLRIMGQLERTAVKHVHGIVSYQRRHGPAVRVQVVRRERMIVIRSRGCVVVGTTGRARLIVLEPLAGDVLEDLQISCEVRNYLFDAR